jgi:uncharacterized protein YoxC
MGEDPMASADPMQDPNAMSGEDPLADAEEENDGSTIDIDGLTAAQDKLNVKQNHIGRDISKVDTRITSLIDTIKNLLSKVDSNNSEIEALKAEFEKRNPTQTEKLNLRSLDSYPFNVKPNDYWKEKEETSNYRIGGDTDEVPEQYDLHQSDVDNVTNWKEIADSLDDSDLTDLTKIFNL